MNNHLLPFSVHYDVRCPGWHRQSSPCIVDANGETVLEMPQYVSHPGEYDRQANDLADFIVTACNLHDELVTVCQQAAACLRNLMPDKGPMSRQMGLMIDELTKVLNKV